MLPHRSGSVNIRGETVINTVNIYLIAHWASFTLEI